MRNLAIVLLAACGAETERPKTVEYVTATVLQPSCGLAGCHSKFKQVDGLVFDNVPDVKIILRADITRENGSRLIGPGPANQQPLAANLRSVDPMYRELFPQMPLDSPMPDSDIDLVLGWLELGAPGACVPEPDICLSQTIAMHFCGPDDEFQYIDCAAACTPAGAGMCEAGACVCP